MAKRTKKTTISQEELMNQKADESQPAVKALLGDKFTSMSNLEASEVALMLQQILRGQDSLLANIQTQGIEIAHLRERQARADEEIAQRLASQEKQIQEVLDKAESLRKTGLAHDQEIAKGMKLYLEAKQDAVANVATKRLQFEEQLAHMEKVQVVWPGELITVMERGQQVAKIIPKSVHIKHKVWSYKPGSVVTVPKCVAASLSDMERSETETNQRKDLLEQNLEVEKLAVEWAKIGHTEEMPK